MKVILVNGSPNAKGSTFTALSEAAGALQQEGIDTEIFQIGKKPISGCIACGYCYEHGKCVMNDSVNDFAEMAKEADGLIFGTPVHYASGAGALIAFMDRLFYTSMDKFAGKAGAAVACCRRGGSTAALDQINKYFTISNMPVVSSNYWNMVHGNSADEVKQDLEGMQVMRGLGRNMAWLLKCIEAGKKAGISFPESEERAWTNFIR